MERWKHVKELFITAADLPAGERSSFLDRACVGDAPLRDQIERLLAADQKNGSGIVSAVEGAARSLFVPEGIIGSRIGPYVIESEIGSGGMGAVYLAIRDDEQYKKRVAIKLIRSGLDTQDMLERFRHERQILANLEHPYISRLLDGGSTPDDRPFLVMEYVQGLPLDVYCRVRDLDLKERCQLFLKICEAVAYAHRNLVVHRDLKPGNILVTEDGSPKLLDFGVAKMMDAEASMARAAMTAVRPVTLDYASPEQIRAEPITTATDVYSLGAILYELLTGQRAHRFSSYSLRELERVVCDVDPPRPSDAVPLLRQRLAGDLDAITMMAMRKEAALRYSTVERLASDLQNYLSGRPVMARQGKLTYRARKYLRRHRIAIAVAASLAVVLLGGAMAAAIEARRALREQARAEVERQHAVESLRRAELSEAAALRESREAERQRGLADGQRREAELQRIAAETQRQIADRRFEQLHQLAGKFVLNFHDAIAKLPGSTPARKMVVETGLQYFDTLMHEAHGNRALLEEIARGYDRLGDVQGNPYYPNLGDLPGALVSYQKAAQIRDSIVDSSPEFTSDRIIGKVRMAQVLHTKGDMQGSERLLREAVRLGEGTQGASSSVLKATMRAYDALGDLANRTGDDRKGVEPYQKVLELATALAKDDRQKSSADDWLGAAHGKLADLYTRLTWAPQALEHIRAALAIDEPRAAADPSNRTLMRRVYIENGILSMLFTTPGGEALAAPGDPEKAMQRATDLAARLSAADPKNETGLMDIVAAESLFGEWLRSHHQTEESLVHYGKALQAAEKQLANGAETFPKYDALVQVHHGIAITLNAVGRFDEAAQNFAKATEYLARAENKSPGLTRLARRRAEITSGTAEMYQKQKSWSDAIGWYRQTIGIFEGLRKKDPANDADLSALPELYFKVADCYAADGQQDRAVESIQLALSLLRELEQRRPLVGEEEHERKDGLAKLAAWK